MTPPPPTARRSVARLLMTGALVLTAGCLRRGQTEVDPVLPLLEAADRAWADRERIGLDEAELPLQEAYGLAPHRPEVLWRLVRLHHATGWTEPTERARLFTWAEARSLGLDCLRSDTTFASAEQRRGLVEAVGTVDDDARRACVAWTSLVWARWVAHMGGGAAAIDLPVARALANRAKGQPDDEHAFLGTWSTALLDAAAPSWADGDATRALSSLEVLIAKHRDELLLQVDRLRHTGDVLTPRYRDELRAALRQAAPDTPEERAALALLLETPDASGPQR